MRGGYDSEWKCVLDVLLCFNAFCDYAVAVSRVVYKSLEIFCLLIDFQGYCLSQVYMFTDSLPFVHCTL